MKSFEEIKQDVRYKAKDLGFRLRVKANEAKNWIYNNKEFVVMVAIPAAVGVVAEARRVNDRLVTERHKAYDVWDPSAGIYVTCKRKMTKAEKVEFVRRHANGEKTYDILKSMRLI